MDKVRKASFDALIKSDTSQSFSNIEINTVISREKFSGKDAALFTAIYMGVIEYRMTLDYVISKYSDIPLEKIDIETKNALRIGLYQLIYLDRIPDYSAINESVELCTKRSKGFVNAVLRSFVRNGKELRLPTEKRQRVCIENSVPYEISDVFVKSYGESRAYELISYHSKQDICIRVNTILCDAGLVLNELEKRNIHAEVSHFSKDVIKIHAPISMIKDLIDTGHIFVQDEASRCAVLVLDPKENEKIADVCACPGGKTFSCAIQMKNKGEILASDLHANKLSLVEKDADRLGLKIIKAKAQNAKEHIAEYEGKFDRVLCDVPCSGLGVIFKKPDIKYKSTEQINALPEIQLQILSNCSSYVKNGGVLVYSTCTLNRAENEDNVLHFLEKNKNFEPVDFEISDIKSQHGMYTFFPDKTGTDGFFVAKMKRVR